LQEVLKVSAFELEDHVTLETWADIVSRSEYQSSVDAKKIRSYKVKGIYAFKEDDASCGASGCQKNHAKGFFVVYAGSKETNLCEVCGKQLLGKSYSEQKRLFRDKRNLKQQQMKLKTFLEQSESIKNRIKDLKQAPYGANWLYRSQTGFEKAYPSELLSILAELAKDKKDSAILDALIKDDDTSSPQEAIDQLEGLGIFNADIKETLMGNILKPLKELEVLIASPESTRSLSRFCKWSDEIEDHFTLAESLVDDGRLFFKSANIERLKSIPLSEKNAMLTRTLRWNCDDGTAK
jgi:hypothetical protein